MSRARHLARTRGIQRRRKVVRACQRGEYVARVDYVDNEMIRLVFRRAGYHDESDFGGDL